MANPQKENGYTPIASEILEHLVKLPLSAAELRVLLWVFRKTYGWNKKEDLISLTQFEQATKMSRPTVVRALKNLVIRGILVKTPKLAYMVEKDWEKWVVKTPKLVKFGNHLGLDALTKSGLDALTHNSNKHIQKKRQPTVAEDATLEGKQINHLLAEFYKTINPLISFKNNTQRDAALEIIKKFGFEEAIDITRYAISVQGDKFAPRITTPLKLKEKYADLEIYKNNKT